MAKRKPDVSFENHGTVILIQPLTKRGTAWVEENISAEGWQMLGNAIAAEPRMCPDVIAGMEDAGLLVIY